MSYYEWFDNWVVRAQQRVSRRGKAIEFQAHRKPGFWYNYFAIKISLMAKFTAVEIALLKFFLPFCDIQYRRAYVVLLLAWLTPVLTIMAYSGLEEQRGYSAVGGEVFVPITLISIFLYNLYKLRFGK